MLESFVIIILIALASIGSITLTLAAAYYYTEIIQPKRYEKEKEREKRTHEEIDRVIDEALRANL